jgi:hypothetical protein
VHSRTLATRIWHAVSGVPDRSGWLHVVLVVVHSTTNVKCACHGNRPGELRRMAVPVSARQVAARRANPGELRGTASLVPA